MADHLWYLKHMAMSAQDLVWTVRQRPIDRLFTSPPKHPERWSTARIIFHLTSYETTIALPTIRQWQDIERLLTDFIRTRDEQIAVLQGYAPAQWDERRQVLWGEFTLSWVVTKTWQYTLEHTDEIARSLLWWDG